MPRPAATAVTAGPVRPGFLAASRAARRSAAGRAGTSRPQSATRAGVHRAIPARVTTSGDGMLRKEPRASSSSWTGRTTPRAARTLAATWSARPMRATARPIATSRGRRRRPGPRPARAITTGTRAAVIAGRSAVSSARTTAKAAVQTMSRPTTENRGASRAPVSSCTGLSQLRVTGRVAQVTARPRGMPASPPASPTPNPWSSTSPPRCRPPPPAAASSPSSRSCRLAPTPSAAAAVSAATATIGRNTSMNRLLMPKLPPAARSP